MRQEREKGKVKPTIGLQEFNQLISSIAKPNKVDLSPLGHAHLIPKDLAKHKLQVLRHGPIPRHMVQFRMHPHNRMHRRLPRHRIPAHRRHRPPRPVRIQQLPRIQYHNPRCTFSAFASSAAEDFLDEGDRGTGVDAVGFGKEAVGEDAEV